MVLAPPGGATLPLVAHLPHGGTAIPPRVRNRLLLDDQALDAELLAVTDWHTPQLFAGAVVRAGGMAIVNRLSRLVVDPERLPNAREPLDRLGLGAVYTRTAAGAPLRPADDIALRVELLDRYFQPWADTAEHLVRTALERWDRCLVLDGHSYPSRPLPYEDPGLDRPDVCLGAQAPHSPEALLRAMEVACTTRGWSVARNTPFAGAYVPLPYFLRDARVQAVMVELNRGRYLDEATGERGAGFAEAAALTAELVALAAGAA